MSQKLTAWILLIAVAGSTFNKIIALVDYNLNKNFIATTLCENRNKPMSCCQGKCFLKKQLQKDEAEKNTPSQAKEKADFVWFCEENATAYQPSININIFFSHYLLKRYSILLPSVFHPPGNAKWFSNYIS